MFIHRCKHFPLLSSGLSPGSTLEQLGSNCQAPLTHFLLVFKSWQKQHRALSTAVRPTLHRPEPKVTIAEVRPAVLRVPRTTTGCQQPLGAPGPGGLQVTLRSDGRCGVGSSAAAQTEAEECVQKAGRVLCVEPHTPYPISKSSGARLQGCARVGFGLSPLPVGTNHSLWWHPGPVAFHSCQWPWAGGIPPGRWASWATLPGPPHCPWPPQRASNKQRPPGC